LAAWFRRSPREADARRLYAGLVEQARAPAFYDQLGVPDSLDGRYEMLALHMALTLRRLKREGAATAALAQALFDQMFADMDRSLREIGVGDLSVGKRVKEMARGLYGRIAAYEAGIAGSDPALEQALARNVYGTLAPPPRPALAELARYVRRAAAQLDGVPAAALDGAATLPWPAVPALGEPVGAPAGAAR
jgi:cytochrome b pre-mRNA-processing protein 3